MASFGVNVHGNSARRGAHSESQYWGEVAIHFSNGRPLVLSISREEHRRLLQQLQCDDEFFHVHSLSNQLVAVRRAAVTDVYMAAEESETYGPEHEAYDVAHVWPAYVDHFWEIVDDLVYGKIEEAESKYGKDLVIDVAMSIGMKVENVDALGEHGRPAVRETAIEEALQTFAEVKKLASNVVWQLSVGKTRQTSALSCDLSRYSWISDTCDPATPMIIAEAEDAQIVFINPQELDYFSIPEHRYRLASQGAGGRRRLVLEP